MISYVICIYCDHGNTRGSSSSIPTYMVSEPFKFSYRSS
ncbi:unnamed protein product [Thlaspi arvense]|uniref:Uncharacterized protein n=1 Tax=Thlaspi arvense TaxID=13288 RepID=A0AAU9RBQ1_THLAR|nr:unnamed protein product [Thlaspi arvense]